MTELRESFEPGSSHIEDFYAWMHKRHDIYWARQQGLPKPWTDDPILQQYKFTNVFRELDPGTLKLREMEKLWVTEFRAGLPVHQDQQTGWMDKDQVAQLIIFNTWWYRIWNWHEHGPNLGFVTSYKQLEDYMMGLHNNGHRMWTSAHMVRGDGGEQKVFTYLRMMRAVWTDLSNLTERILRTPTIQNAFNQVLEYPLIGDFTAYEIASDLRWSLLDNPSDRYTWGNPGNGAVRGLSRLGLKPTVESMRWLWLSTPHYLRNTCIMQHFPCEVGEVHNDIVVYENDPAPPWAIWPPFEIREIEHSLCEFDKYERARLGQGTPRQKFNGL